MFDLILEATLETLLMISVSAISGILVGVPLGVLLFVTKEKLLLKNVVINKLASFIVNVVRSIPYIVLIVLMIPFTKFLVGTSIGNLAASVPLSLAAIVIIAKLTEEAMDTVDKGLIEMGLSFGASTTQIVYKILLVESLPSIIAGIVLVIINLIGFSSMSGTVGGGGLGYIAVKYGYQRYDLPVLFIIVVVLILMVNIIQFIGDYTISKIRK